MYENKSNIYFNKTTTKLLDLIPEKNRRGSLLEIGAGAGNTLIYAKENGFAREIHGVELFEIEDSNQSSPLFDTFTVGDIEKITLPFKEETFDVIIAGDVLEHLVDPYSTLNKLKKYLKKDGVFIASIPNIR